MQKGGGDMNRSLKPETVLKMIEELEPGDELLLNACMGQSELPLKAIEPLVMYSFEWAKQVGGSQNFTEDEMQKWLNAEEKLKTVAVAASCIGRKVPFRIIDQLLTQAIEFRDDDLKDLVVEAVVGQDVPNHLINDWAFFRPETYFNAAMAACIGRKNPNLVGIIYRGLDYDSKVANEYAIKACDEALIDFNHIRGWINSANGILRLAAINACRGRYPIPTGIVKAALRYTDSIKVPQEAPSVRLASELSPEEYAQILVVFRDYLPKSVLYKALFSAEPEIILGALEACQKTTLNFRIRGRIINIILDKNVGDFSPEKKREIRKTAIKTAHKANIRLPLKRDFMPPEIVFMKCANDVIVSAHIHGSALIRGNPGKGLCYTDGALIMRVEGSFYGERVGVSMLDKKTLYYVGKNVIIKNFDYLIPDSDSFPFFCTRKEAEEFSGF